MDEFKPTSMWKETKKKELDAYIKGIEAAKEAILTKHELLTDLEAVTCLLEESKKLFG